MVTEEYQNKEKNDKIASEQTKHVLSMYLACGNSEPLNLTERRQS